MAIVRVHGRPTYFVTFTCNPGWPEIQAALLPGQDAQSRPDLVARVFHQKLKSLMKELTTDGILGHCVSVLMVVEFQKRGKFTFYFTIHIANGQSMKWSGSVRWIRNPIQSR